MIHGDSVTLDRLTIAFEADGFDVVTAMSAFRAQALLEDDRHVDVVVAPWDDATALGGDVYRWALRRRPELRGQFVFLADAPPADFDQVVGGRCLAVSPAATVELLQVADAAVIRARRGQTAGALVVPSREAPVLLLAEDEPILLLVMTRLLSQAGYRVISVEGGHAATRWLEDSEVDVIVADWQMDAGSGAELYHWLVVHRPHLARRLVFISGSRAADVAREAPDCPVFPKGQDSGALLRTLAELVRGGR
jgi:CheY-like chemotaxis protein